MTIEEIWEAARGRMAPNCQACKECNGIACKGKVPGVGAVGDASSWTACMAFLKRVKLNMDTVYEFHGTDTRISMFGRTWEYPFFVCPMPSYTASTTDAAPLTASGFSGEPPRNSGTTRFFSLVHDTDRFLHEIRPTTESNLSF
jgi:hypothetical protein